MSAAPKTAEWSPLNHTGMERDRSSNLAAKNTYSNFHIILDLSAALAQLEMALVRGFPASVGIRRSGSLRNYISNVTSVSHFIQVNSSFFSLMYN